MDSHVKYLIFSSILIIACFLLVPIVFFYQDSDDRHDSLNTGDSVAGGDSENTDFPDDNRSKSCPILHTPFAHYAMLPVRMLLFPICYQGLRHERERRI